MNQIKLLIFTSIVLLMSCVGQPERPEPILEEGYQPTTPVSNTPPASTTAEPPQNAAGVWHYTCSNGCAGGAGSAEPCAVCGAALVHNTAYHDNAGAPTTKPVEFTPTTAPPGAPTDAPNTNTPEPAQNAAGVWHYTCPDGCAGGAGTSEPCGVCGKTLVHNSAYH